MDGVSQPVTASQHVDNIETSKGTNSAALALPFTKTKFLGEPVVNGFRPVETLLSAAEVAWQLGVCTATVYKLVERGDLAHVRIRNAVRVAPADLAAFVLSRRT